MRKNNQKTTLTKIINLFYFLIKSELKSKQTILMVALYVFIAILICILTISQINSEYFSALFWIIVIFTSLQGISKSFLNVQKGNFLFWNQCVSPSQFLLSKLLLNWILILFYTLISFIIFYVFNDVSISNIFVFLVSVFFTSLSLSSIFTMNSSIATKTENGSMLMPVLSFPLVLPVLLIGIKLSNKAIIGNNNYFTDILILILLFILIVFLGLLLIKFIWKD